MKKFHQIASMTENEDLKMICNHLQTYKEGDVIDSLYVANMVALEHHTVVFMLDTLFEIGALIPHRDPPPAVGMAA